MIYGPCGERNINSPSMDDIIDNVELKYDEIKQYINTRYVCPPEAMHRLYEYKMSELSHWINRLAVYIENEQNVFFREGCEDEINTRNVDTTLMAWFKLNKKDAAANKYLHCNIPNY